MTEARSRRMHRQGLTVLRQKRFDLGSRRRAARTADAAALDTGNRGAKAQRRGDIRAFRQRQRKAAMQGVAGAERIDGVDLEHRLTARRAAVEIDNVIRTVADREK